MLTHPASVPGLGVGGAHLATICDASMPTYQLSHWVRGRTRGPRLSLEAAVRMQTLDTAALFGLGDRGTLEPGKRADCNVIDLDRLDLELPRPVADLPAGGVPAPGRHGLRRDDRGRDGHPARRPRHRRPARAARARGPLTPTAAPRPGGLGSRATCTRSPRSGRRRSHAPWPTVAARTSVRAPRSSCPARRPRAGSRSRRPSPG
jgi:hypothetical protein